MPLNKQVQCQRCSSSSIVKKGIRKNKLQELQQYQCKECNYIFTQNKSKNTTYPITTILKAVSNYNLGHTLQQTKEKLNINATLPAISSWLNKYKHICTFERLRNEAIKLYQPKNIIFKKSLQHQQVYLFQYHKAKLHLLFNSIKYNNMFTNQSMLYVIKDYLGKIQTKDFPHHIFAYHQEAPIDSRASQIKFKHLRIEAKSKNNFACKLAKLALNLAATNKQRHEAIQNFMLINDSTTIAVEVPVYFTNWDAGYYRNQKGFDFPLSSYKTPITGHIDILQIRNGLIHILDYKPEAKSQNPIEQLTIYALALSRKLNLPLYYFKCLTCEARDASLAMSLV